jgi:GT2 family glycosyltransferase
MAVKDRHHMTIKLLDQLDGAERVFIFDNGSRYRFPGSTHTPGATIHEMWNAGLVEAARAAGGRPHNVAVLNNDLEVHPGFLATLAEGLRSSDDNWIAYPNWQGLDIPVRVAVPVDRTAGQSMSGWAFMVRGEVGLRFDEQFQWWYGDDDIQRQAEKAGGRVVCVGGVTCTHLEPGRSTDESPELRARARADMERFVKKWP